MLLGCLPYVLGRGELSDHLIDVGYLDRAPAVHVVPGPRLAGHQRPQQAHLLAVFEREPCLHLGARGARCLNDDAALADARGHDVAAREGVSAGWAGGPELGNQRTAGCDLL